MKRINVAITGFGSIGKRVATLLMARHQDYRQRFSLDIRITGVCGASAGLIDANGISRERLEDRHSFVPSVTGPTFIDCVPADVLIEAGPSDFRTGGPALAYIRTALRRRMHVIAISKGALALDVEGLLNESHRQGVSLRFSGATAAALPTIDLLQYNLAGCRVTQVEAILTGTTNLILSEMMDQGCTFEEALQNAQRLGIAEPDPSYDVEGWDTACKLTIIANAIFKAGFNVQSLPRTGIRHISPNDVQIWKAQGLMPRLVGFINHSGDATDGGVELRLFPQDHPFTYAHGKMKAIRVVTDEMGELCVMGGASDPLATAAAALKDFEHTLASMP
ncbi:homoserine dehydrogenase [Pseudomonas sp. GM48]|uniref:homoserine dehydrogenase n=1 Tax=Pseudomonas sp. GM48 TaxID=1144330 RepID=UPI0002701FFB|nr:homoserine dehydrogenase [Pseudomonas sp. GM48]EJM62077.1 homoserine dehydrogenase [Pseudomonas sp. GM48]